MPEIKNRDRGHLYDSHYGEGQTSEIIPFLSPTNILGSSDLINWIKTECLSVLPIFYDFNSKDVVIERSWMNKMDYGSQGRCHRHLGLDYDGLTKTPDLIGIFYVNAPIDSSELIFIKDGSHGEFHNAFPEDQKYYIKPKSGELIIHKPDVWHAVGVHNNQDPRICFVFHLSFIINNTNAH